MQDKKLEFFLQRVARRASELPADDQTRYLLYLRESNLVDEAGYPKLRRSADEMAERSPRIGFNQDA